jgi:hypothetical protein
VHFKEEAQKRTWRSTRECRKRTQRRSFRAPPRAFRPLGAARGKNQHCTFSQLMTSPPKPQGEIRSRPPHDARFIPCCAHLPSLTVKTLARDRAEEQEDETRLSSDRSPALASPLIPGESTSQTPGLANRRLWVNENKIPKVLLHIANFRGSTEPGQALGVISACRAPFSLSCRLNPSDKCSCPASPCTP